MTEFNLSGLTLTASDGVEYEVGFTLKPTGFFAANAAGDIPPDRNARSVLAGEQRPGGSCCQGT